MTRSSEFCWIAEMRDGRMVQAISADAASVYWTKDQDMALRITDAGRGPIQRVINSVGFRKVLAS